MFFNKEKKKSNYVKAKSAAARQRQKAAIKSYYARKASESKNSKTVQNIDSNGIIQRQSRYEQKESQIQQKVVEPVKPSFKLPLRNGGHRWNIYYVPNYILNGHDDGNAHGGLVIDEENNNVLLAQVTHSAKKGSRNNLEIRNLSSKDTDENGNLRQSYIERRLIASLKKGAAEEGIDASALKDQMNDLQFTDEEKQDILDKLSHLSTAEERYNKFKELASKKKNDT